VLWLRQTIQGDCEGERHMPAHDDLMLELPASASTRLIDFDRARIVSLESDPPQYLLVVNWTKPYVNMTVWRR
jgi:hypothetical protein